MEKYCIIDGLNWINIFGLVIVVLMLIPNILYAIKFKGQEVKCKCCRSMYILEQVGRYGSMFLMAFNIGIAEFGFASDVPCRILVRLCAIFLQAEQLEAHGSCHNSIVHISFGWYSLETLFTCMLCHNVRAFACMHYAERQL